MLEGPRFPVEGLFLIVGQCQLFSEPPIGVGRRGSPRFVPISPFSSDLFRFALLVVGNTPICSDLLRFLPICSDLLTEQIRTNQGDPFLPTPFANPRFLFDCLIVGHRSRVSIAQVCGHLSEYKSWPHMLDMSFTLQMTSEFSGRIVSCCWSSAGAWAFRSCSAAIS